MLYMKTLKYLFFLSFVFIISCDIIDKPSNLFFFIDDTLSTNIDNDTNNYSKKVLIINFTGVRCPNCPHSHEEIIRLNSIFNNKIIDVSFHGTTLAATNSLYKIDLRTSEGNELINDFAITQIPIGMVGFFNKSELKFYSEWENLVNEQIIQNHFLKINSNILKISDSLFNINITLMKKFDTLQLNKLFVYVTEDSILSRQAIDVSPGYIENYYEMNVFRKSITNVKGNEINRNTISFYLTIQKAWKIKNLKIVVFVTSIDNNKILNVEQFKLIE